MSGLESVGAVFSKASSSLGNLHDSIDGRERISKVTEYVERTSAPDGDSTRNWHYYVVLETASHHRIVTEFLKHGQVTWDENPAYLDDRISLSKVIDSVQQSTGVTVRDMKVFQTTAATNSGMSSGCARKKYAQNAFNRAGKMRPTPAWLSRSMVNSGLR